MRRRTVLSLVCALTVASVGMVARAGDLGVSQQQPASGRGVEISHGWMVPYEEKIPGTKARFRMTPIPGGVFLMGSPEDEEGREEDEGPRVRISVAPMWVGECEVTWAEYRSFMNLYSPLKQLEDTRYRVASLSADQRAARLANAPAVARYLVSAEGVDAITCPTPLYDSTFTYEPGEEPEQPAVTMTQFAAKQYTKWISKITGRDYRLPTEAEWEYAARAGATTAYTFGESANELADYAWFYENSDDRTNPVGEKKPNAWGLYDTHGNAAEWVLDFYAADQYASLSTGQGGEPLAAASAVRRATTVWPRAYRGGSWQDDPDALRCAARAGSQDEDWTLSDPNLPISPWWFTEYESQAVGMRVVRPLLPMDDEMKQLAWEADVEDLRFDIEDRLAEGRGVQAAANPLLPDALRELPMLREKPTPTHE